MAYLYVFRSPKRGLAKTRRGGTDLTMQPVEQRRSLPEKKEHAEKVMDAVGSSNDKFTSKSVGASCPSAGGGAVGRNYVRILPSLATPGLLM